MVGFFQLTVHLVIHSQWTATSNTYVWIYKWVNMCIVGVVFTRVMLLITTCSCLNL